MLCARSEPFRLHKLPVSFRLTIIYRIIKLILFVKQKIKKIYYKRNFVNINCVCTTKNEKKFTIKAIL